MRERFLIGTCLAFAVAQAGIAQETRAFRLQQRDLDHDLLNELRLALGPGEYLEAFFQLNVIIVQAGTPTIDNVTRYLELVDAAPEEREIDAAWRRMRAILWRFEHAKDPESKLKALDELDKATMAVRRLLWKEGKNLRK